MGVRPHPYGTAGTHCTASAITCPSVPSLRISTQPSDPALKRYRPSETKDSSTAVALILVDCQDSFWRSTALRGHEDLILNPQSQISDPLASS